MEDTIPDSFPYLLLITEGCMHLLILSLCTCTAPGAQCGWCKLCKGADMLTGIRDTQVIFVNLDKDRILNMMVQRMGEQGEQGEQGTGQTWFVQNSFIMMPS